MLFAPTHLQGSALPLGEEPMELFSADRRKIRPNGFCRKATKNAVAVKDKADLARGKSRAKVAFLSTSLGRKGSLRIRRWAKPAEAVPPDELDAQAQNPWKQAATMAGYGEMWSLQKRARIFLKGVTVSTAL
jgi:hypothetical protein